MLKVGESVELMPGGSGVAVNLGNLEQYIELTKAKMYETAIKSISDQAKAFLEGFRKVMNVKYLKKFTPKELRKLAEGDCRISGKSHLTKLTS